MAKIETADSQNGQGFETNIFLAIPIIAYVYISFEPEIPLLGTYSIEIFVKVHKDMFPWVLIVSWFINYKLGNNPAVN